MRRFLACSALTLVLGLGGLGLSQAKADCYPTPPCNYRPVQTCYYPAWRPAWHPCAYHCYRPHYHFHCGHRR
jgi:hypothetical protein